MKIINFSHPLTDSQLAQVEALTGKTVSGIVTLAVQFDNNHPFQPQLEGLMEQLPLSSEELQTESIIVNLPALNYIAALVLTELHGRMGYFPPCLRLRRVEDSLTPTYEVAEVLNLQNVRDQSRRKRGEK